MTDITREAVEARAALLRSDYAADGAAFDADMLLALLARAEAAERERDETLKSAQIFVDNQDDLFAAGHKDLIAQRDQLAERDKEISELHDTASEQRGELSELERDYAHQRELLTDARATIARQSEVLKKAWEALKGVIRVADRSTTEFDAARAAVLAIDEALK